MSKFTVGEEIEVLYVDKGKEKWIKTIVRNYDDNKKEVSCYIKCEIREDKVRKLNDKVNGRIKRHEEYYVTVSGFYIDKELRINVQCKILSCDIYENGLKKYLIRYKDEDNKEKEDSVNGDKIEFVELPIQEETDNSNVAKIYGVDIGGYKIVMTSCSTNDRYKLYETDLGEKYLPSGIVFLEGNIGKRMIGQKAFNPSRRDVKHSITSIKVLIGKKYSELEKENDYSLSKKNIERLGEDGIIFKIKEDKLSVEHIYLMFLSKIQEIYKRDKSKEVGKEVGKEEVKDEEMKKEDIDPMPLIISIPNSYGELEKETIKILCNRLNINLSLIPESLSVSICYGYENNTSFVVEKYRKAEYLLIIDIGYLYMNLTISQFEKDKCTILNDMCNNEVNGKNIDELLFEYFEPKINSEFQEINTKDDEVIIHKIMSELIKCKCKLSADGASSINLSINLTQDETYDSVLTVDELNEIIQPICERLKEILREFLKESDLNDEMRREIKILPVGGSMRIPYLQKIIIDNTREVLNNENIKMIKTLNMDECISSGNSYYGSILNGNWKYEVIYKGRKLENDKKTLTKDHTLCLKKFNELQNKMINRRRELEDILELYDYLELNLNEIEMRMVKDDCDYKSIKSVLTNLMKLLDYCCDCNSSDSISEEAKDQKGYKIFVQYYIKNYLNKAKEMKLNKKEDVERVEKLLNEMDKKVYEKDISKLSKRIKSLLSIQKNVMINEMKEKLKKIISIDDKSKVYPKDFPKITKENYSKAIEKIEQTELNEKSIIETLLYLTDYSKMSGDSNGKMCVKVEEKGVETNYSKFHEIVKIIYEIKEKNYQINVLPIIKEGIDLFDDYLNKEHDENKIKSRICNYQRKVDYYCNYLTYNNNDKVKLLVYGYYNEIWKYENEIIEKNRKIQEISVARNEYEAQYLKYVDLMDEIQSSKWECIVIDKETVEILKIYGYRSIEKGNYPDIEENEKIGEKRIFSTKEEYEEEKGKLKKKCDSITTYKSLLKYIDEIKSKLNEFTKKCDESKVAIDVSKYEKIIKENDNINDLMKGLEELDLSYTKAISSEYLKKLETVYNTYKDIMNEKQKNQFEEYKRELKQQNLRYEGYEKIKDKVENIFIELKNNPKFKNIKTTKEMEKTFKEIKWEIGKIVYEKKIDSYGVIINQDDETKLFEVYSFNTNRIYEGINENELSSKNSNKRKGIINEINGDGSYNITYEGGGYDFNVEEGDIHKPQENKTNLKIETRGEILGKKIRIGDFYRIMFDGVEKSVQIVRINKTDCCVNYNNQYIINGVKKSDLRKCSYNPTFRGKYNIMDIVEVETKDIISYPCNIIYSDFKQKGNIIGYNEKENIPIIEIEYKKRLDIKDVIYENQYLVGDKVLYKEDLNGKEKWKEGEIVKINENSLSIKSYNSLEKLVNYSGIHPYFNPNYHIYTKVNIHFNEKCVLPGIVLSYNRRNYSYDILLLNKYLLHDIPQYIISISKLKMNDEVMFIQNGRFITKGKISSIYENGKYSITDNRRSYGNILPSELHLFIDYNYRIGMKVYAHYSNGFYKGKINELKYKLVNESKYESMYGVLYDDGDYNYVDEDNIHPYNDSNTLFVVGDKIININGEKGIITKVEDVNCYSVLYENGKYEYNVLLERIKRDELMKKNKYNIGDIVFNDGKEWKVIFVYYNENCYDLEENGNYHQIKYTIKEKELSLKVHSHYKFEVNEKVLYNNQVGFIHSIVNRKYVICIENGRIYYYAKDINENMIKKIGEEGEKEEEIIEYSIGEEVEAYLMKDGKEGWIKALISEYDEKRNEFNLKVGSVIRYGIKPENVRKIKY